MQQPFLSKQFVEHKTHTRLRNTIQLESFRDESSNKHKKYNSYHSSTKNRSIHSLAVESNGSPRQGSSLINPNVFEIAQASKASIKRHKQYSPEHGIHKEHLLKDIESAKKPRDIKLQRYSRLDNEEKKSIAEDCDQQFQRQNKEKITLLKRIIEHYNIKSLERTYYSNLVNNLGIKINSATETKNRFVTVKNSPIKLPSKKDMSNNLKNQNCIKIKQYPNLLTMDIYDEFFKNTTMKVEARAITKVPKIESEQKELLLTNTPSTTIYQTKPQRQKFMRQTKTIKQPSFASTIKSSKASKKQISKIEAMMENKIKQIQMLNDTVINQKVNKYKEFLFMINFTNNIYRDLDIQRYQTPFKVYIGRGNNSNLVAAIMKKRFWFEIVKNKDEANFLWTQLKEEKIFTKQNRLYEGRSRDNIHKTLAESPSKSPEKMLEEECLIQIGDNIENPEVLQTLEMLMEKSSELATRSKRQLKPVKINTKTMEIFNPQSRIFSQNQNKIYQQIIGLFAYKRKSKFADRQKYFKSLRIIKQEQMGNEIIQNHLPFNGLLGNKKAMYYMLKEYCRLMNRDIFEIVPLTFHIRKGLLDDQFKDFMNRYQQNRNNNVPNYWIIKPGQFSNRGQGITCTNKIEDVRVRIGNLKKLGKNKSLILQQYLINPLLYNGRKFDIRTYMLVSINNGKIRAYWYQDGYVRTSSYIWRLSEITDTYIHLTNDAIQKYSDDYGKYEPGNKLTYSELQRYLDTLPRSGGKTYNFQAEIYPKLKQIATDAVKASFCFIDPERKANNFEVFGFDFMIDNNFKPWLIEINTNPCLEINCPVLERIIPSMVENALRIGLDPIFPPPLNYSSTYKYNIPQNALHYNKFELIFDEQRDGAALAQLYKDSKIVESIDDIEQDKETYEEEGAQINLEQS